VAGQAILSLGGRRDFSWTAAPVGLAALLVAAGIAIKLPGHATAAAIALAALTGVSVLWLWLSGGALGFVRSLAIGGPAALLFLLGFALLLPSVRGPRSALPLGVIAAGSVYAYSFPGLAWLAGAAVAYAVLASLWAGWARARAGPRSSSTFATPYGANVQFGRRRVGSAALAAVVVLLVLIGPELPRLVDFT